MDPDEVTAVRDGGGMTAAERQVWRERNDRRRRGLPTSDRPRRAERPTPVTDPAEHAQRLAARCLRLAQEARARGSW